MQVLHFLKIIERIIVFIVIAGFIPLSFYVFSSKSLNISNQTQTAYKILKNQIQSGFILDIRKNCTMQDANLSNKYCFTYCNINTDCSIVDQKSQCKNGIYKYSNFNKKFCASGQIKNKISFSNQMLISLSADSSYPPLFSLQLENNMSYYAYNGEQKCIKIVQSLGENIQSTERIQSSGYLISLRYLYYTLCPIFGFTIISFLIQAFTRWDCKRLMQISLFNSCIIEVSIIVIGIIYDSLSSDMELRIQSLGQFCVLSSTSSGTAKYLYENLTMDMQNGLSTVFSIVMGIVGVVQVFLIIGLLIVWILEIRMYKLKKEDVSSGYQLQTM